MNNKVVILIIAHKAKLTNEEKASLKQCHRILAKYPIKLICPQGLNVEEYKKLVPNVQFEFIDPKWQSNYRMFNRLKIEPMLYKKFKNFEHILYYELDAWVFQDDLEYWCDQPYDFIGAPWVDKIKNDKAEFWVIGGNGGMSLRNVKAHLRLWTIKKNIKSSKDVWVDYLKMHGMIGTYLRIPVVIARMMGVKNNSLYFLKHTEQNEDDVWSRDSVKIDPTFRVAPPDVAYKFAFEKHPSTLYKMNGNKLPFACHAWMKYEPEFWKAFIKLEQ